MGKAPGLGVQAPGARGPGVTGVAGAALVGGWVPAWFSWWPDRAPEASAPASPLGVWVLLFPELLLLPCPP